MVRHRRRVADRAKKAKRRERRRQARLVANPKALRVVPIRLTARPVAERALEPAIVTMATPPAELWRVADPLPAFVGLIARIAA